MPAYRLYDIQITNQYTNKTAEYNDVLSLALCSETINKHFGCPMITKHGVTNMMIRGKEGSPERFIGVSVTSKKRGLFNKNKKQTDHTNAS
jgi:hypothetical protein